MASVLTSVNRKQGLNLVPSGWLRRCLTVLRSDFFCKNSAGEFKPQPKPQCRLMKLANASFPISYRRAPVSDAGQRKSTAIINIAATRIVRSAVNIGHIK